MKKPMLSFIFLLLGLSAAAQNSIDSRVQTETGDLAVFSLNTDQPEEEILSGAEHIHISKGTLLVVSVSGKFERINTQHNARSDKSAKKVSVAKSVSAKDEKVSRVWAENSESNQKKEPTDWVTGLKNIPAGTGFFNYCSNDSLSFPGQQRGLSTNFRFIRKIEIGFGESDFEIDKKEILSDSYKTVYSVRPPPLTV